MIVDKFNNIQFYKGMLTNLEEGLRAVQALADSPETGRYEFGGGFFLVQEGTTKPLSEGEFEAHRRYVDVQIVLEGSEEVAWADIEDLKESGDYNAESDKAMYTGNEATVMKMTAGMCYIAFPHDAHKAVRHTAKPQTFKKIVMKLPVIG